MHTEQALKILFPTVEIKDCNVTIDARNLDQPIRNDIKTWK